MICPPLFLSGPHLFVREPFRSWVALVAVVARLSTHGFCTPAVAERWQIMAVIETLDAWSNFAEVTVEPTPSPRWAHTVTFCSRGRVSFHGFVVPRVRAPPVLVLQAVAVTVMDSISPARAVACAPTVSIVVVTPTPSHTAAVPFLMDGISWAGACHGVRIGHCVSTFAFQALSHYFGGGRVGGMGPRSVTYFTKWADVLA